MMTMTSQIRNVNKEIKIKKKEVKILELKSLTTDVKKKSLEGLNGRFELTSYQTQGRSDSERIYSK